jgi:hypothetical protein
MNMKQPLPIGARGSFLGARTFGRIATRKDLTNAIKEAARLAGGTAHWDESRSSVIVSTRDGLELFRALSKYSSSKISPWIILYSSEFYSPEPEDASTQQTTTQAP